MLGVIVNVFTVLLGSSIGLLCKKGIPERMTSAIMTALGLCTVFIGISGALEGNNTLVLIISMVMGTAIGTALDIDGGITRLSNWVERKFPAGAKGGVSVAQGFMTASLLFCVGAMTIVGSLEAGLTGDNSTLFTKALLDFCSSMMMAAAMGIGVLYAAGFVLVMQGALVLFAGVLGPLLSTAAIAEMTCAGSVMIIGLGLNLIGITKIKVADMLPGIVIAPCALAVFNLISQLLTGAVG